MTDHKDEAFPSGFLLAAVASYSLVVYLLLMEVFPFLAPDQSISAILSNFFHSYP